MTVPEVAPAPSAATPASRGERALDWWQRYCHPANGDPGTRARLRRCRANSEALAIRPAVSLARQLGAASENAPDWRVRGALDLARVLAHVQAHDGTRHPMRAAGWQKFVADPRKSAEEPPVLSDVRFRRLVQTGDGEEKVAAFARLIKLLGGTVNVETLANDFLLWNHPEYGDRVRERWAFEYYAAGRAAPTLSTPDTITEDDDA